MPDPESVALYVSVTGPLGLLHDTGSQVIVAPVGGELSARAVNWTG